MLAIEPVRRAERLSAVFQPAPSAVGGVIPKPCQAFSSGNQRRKKGNSGPATVDAGNPGGPSFRSGPWILPGSTGVIVVF